MAGDITFDSLAGRRRSQPSWLRSSSTASGACGCRSRRSRSSWASPSGPTCPRLGRGRRAGAGLALLGLAFVLFLAGFELDLQQVRGRLLRAAGSATLRARRRPRRRHRARPGRLGRRARAWPPSCCRPRRSHWSRRSLREGDQLRTAPGPAHHGVQASVSEFAAVALLSLLFTQHTKSTSVRVALAAAFVGLIAVVGLVAAADQPARVVEPAVRAPRRRHVADPRARGDDADGPVRRPGPGGRAGGDPRRAGGGRPPRRPRCGALRKHRSSAPSSTPSATASSSPVFFIWSGMSIDLDALRGQPSRIVLIGLFFVALLAVHIVALPLYRRAVGARSAASWPGSLGVDVVACRSS